MFTRALPETLQDQLQRVIAMGLSGGGLSDDTARLPHAVQEIITSPYEHLCHRVAQGLITTAEQVAIERAQRRARSDPIRPH